MPKFSVALIGSSGGGSATMSSGEALIALVREHLRSIGMIDKNNGEQKSSNADKEQLSRDTNNTKSRKSSSRRSSGIEYEDMLRFLCAGSSRRSSVYMPSLNKSDDVKKDNYIVDLVASSFVICESGLDFVADSMSEVMSELWVIRNNNIEMSFSGVLSETNLETSQEDVRISQLILDGSINALIVISSDPFKTNSNSIHAAISKKIPIVGTGGTSISYIATNGGNIIGSSGGSVATTSTSKSVCFAAALASYWKLDYYPPIYSRGLSLQAVAGATLPIFLAMSILKLVVRGLLRYADSWANLYPSECIAQAILLSQQQIASSLSSPSTTSVSTQNIKTSQKILGKLSRLFEKVIKGVTSVPSLAAAKTTAPVCIPTNYGYLVGILVTYSSRLIIAIESRTLPLVVCAVSCVEVSGLAELSMLTGAAAGSLVADSVLAACIGGAVCGMLLPGLLLLGARRALLPTASTVVAVGLSAVIGGAVAAALSHWMGMITEAIRNNLWTLPNLLLRLIRIDVSLYPNVLPGLIPIRTEWIPLIYGAVVGWLVSWGSERGLYHLVMLPLILVEMERADLSVLGAMDLVCLCAPSAGVCAAVWTLASVHSYTRSDEFQKKRTVQMGSQDMSTSEGTPAAGDATAGIAAADDDDNLDALDAAIDIHRRVGYRGFISAFFMGDFVEACYPYTMNSKILLYTIRICCAVAGAIISAQKIRCSAYLPFPIALFLAFLDSNIASVWYLFIALSVCFVVPFVVSLVVLPNIIRKV